MDSKKPDKAQKADVPKTEAGLLSRLLEKKWLILLVAGAVLLLLSMRLGKTETDTPDTSFDMAAYAADLTEDARLLCVKASGDPAASVTLYFAGRESYVYAKDESGNGGRDYVTSGGSGLLLQVKMPEVSGITVVCRGGSTSTVKRELTELLSSLFGVGYDRIHISESALREA